MENGLYHAILTLPDDVTNFVVSLRDGIIEGGDSVSCFSGTVQFKGDRFTAELFARKYAELDRYLPVFGLLPAKVTISGKVTGLDSAVGEATCSQPLRAVARVELRRLRFQSADPETDRQAA